MSSLNDHHVSSGQCVGAGMFGNSNGRSVHSTPCSRPVLTRCHFVNSCSLALFTLFLTGRAQG